MINAFILCDLFENFRKILRQTEKEVLSFKPFSLQLLVKQTDDGYISITLIYTSDNTHLTCTDISNNTVGCLPAIVSPVHTDRTMTMD